jgi:hypothetical protein
VPSRIIGPDRDEGKEGRRKLINEKIYNWYFLANIFQMIKLRRMKWAELIARM